LDGCLLLELPLQLLENYKEITAVILRIIWRCCRAQKQIKILLRFKLTF
jgi:hypothetical protein